MSSQRFRKVPVSYAVTCVCLQKDGIIEVMGTDNSYGKTRGLFIRVLGFRQSQNNTAMAHMVDLAVLLEGCFEPRNGLYVTH